MDTTVKRIKIQIASSTLHLFHSLLNVLISVCPGQDSIELKWVWFIQSSNFIFASKNPFFLHYSTYTMVNRTCRTHQIQWFQKNICLSIKYILPFPSIPQLLQ